MSKRFKGLLKATGSSDNNTYSYTHLDITGSGVLVCVESGCRVEIDGVACGALIIGHVHKAFESRCIVKSNSTYTGVLYQVGV